jgi:hypothetical protein
MRIYAVGLLVMVALWIATTQPAAGQTTFEHTVEGTITVDERGTAHVQQITQYPPSELATELKATAISNLEGVKDALISGARRGFARYDFEIKNPSVEITGLSEGENLTDTFECDIEGFATFNSNDNVWTITFRQWTLEEAQEFINSIKSTQDQIATLAPDARSRTTTKLTVLLPSSAQIVNSGELENRTIEDNYGGGSYARTATRVVTLNGRSAVIKESEVLMGPSAEITITPGELSAVKQGWQIIYTGAPPPLGSDYLLYLGIGVAIAVVLAIVVFVKRRGGEKLPEVPAEKW